MYVFCHRRSAPTGRKLAAVFGLPVRRRDPLHGSQIALRWGTAERPLIPSVIQPAAAIARAGNKLAALQIMQAAGIPVPEFTTVQPINGTWLGRRLRGMGGQDIVVQPEGQITYGFAESDFWTKYIPNRREYRIHVVGGEVVRVQGKYLDFPQQHSNPHIKNYSQGYRFRTPERQLHRNRIDAAKNAIAALGLDFGAVDLLVSERGDPFVLEVNTAPKLAPRTARQYASALVSLASDRGHTLTINEGAFLAFGGVNE